MGLGRSWRVSRSAALGAVLGLLASVVVAVAPASAAPADTLALSKGAFVSGTNTPLTTPVTPGGGFDYRLSASCSGLTEGCIGATTTDVLPPGIDFVGFDSSPLYTVTYDAATGTVTVTYTSALPSPPILIISTIRNTFRSVTPVRSGGPPGG